MAELRAKFLPQFIADTRARLRTAMSLIPPAGPGGPESAEQIATMMHSITGEAMLIGSPDLALLARAAGGAARRYLETNNDSALVACARALRSFVRAVDELVVLSAAPPGDAITAPQPVIQKRVRVVVVDDSPLNAALLRETLLGEGFEAIALGDDAELIMQQLETFRPQVLLVDWIMPGCDTTRLCRRIRATRSLDSMRVLLVTSLPEREAESLAVSLGLNGALSKAQGMPAIISRVHAVLKEKP